MEFIGAEVSHKIRSAIKAKLMELGAYVDEELPDYIMVMVANKRAKAQMDGDLQLFLGSNTSHFTSWLYQVLQKLQEVTVGNLEKKSSKIGSTVMKDIGSAKRKSTTTDSDSHRKEKRRKSSENKKSKKIDLEVSKDGKKDLEPINSSKISDLEKYTRAHNTRDILNPARSETSDSVVSSSADSKSNKKTVKDRNEKLQDSITVKRTVVKQSLSNGGNKCEDKNYLSRLRAEALRSCDERLGARCASDNQDVKPRVLCKDESDSKRMNAKTVYPQPPQKAKIVLMHSDDEDDDEDFINIKADAEAEQLLKEELPREALEAALETPESTPLAADDTSKTAVPSESVDVEAEGCARSSELSTIPLRDNLVPKRLASAGAASAPSAPVCTASAAAAAPSPRHASASAGVTPTPSAPGAQASSESQSVAASSSLTPVTVAPIMNVSVVSNSGSTMRKRLADPEESISQPKMMKEEERSVGSGLSIKNRLGLKKTIVLSSIKRNSEVKVTSRLGLKQAGDQMHNSEDRDLTVKKAVPTMSILSRVVPVRSRRERTVDGGMMLEEPLRQEEEEEEEYDPSNPAVGTVASVVRVKPRPKVPAALQANKNLILKAVAEAQKSVSSAPMRPEPAARHPPVWKRTNAGFVRKVENNVGVTFPNRHLQLHNEYGDSSDRDINPDSTRLVSGGAGNDKIIIKVSSSANTDKAPGKETCVVQASPEEMSDEDHLASVLQFHEEDEVIEDDEDDVVEVDEAIVRSVASEEADSLNSSRAVYPPVGLASRMPRERTSVPVQYDSPQFLVTLDGLDPDVFGSRTTSLDDQAVSKEDFDMENLDSSGSMDNSPKKVKTPIIYKVESTEETSEPSTLPKSLERCKYWPSCRLGAKCNFHHPVSPCKTFPKCPFGDKCLYIHPFCKFNSACTRRDCPFVHAAPRLLVSAAPRPAIIPKAVYTPVCHFFPKCSNISCRYLHPKACRYGKFCSKQDCNYIHQDIPSVDKLKWTSPFKT